MNEQFRETDNKVLKTQDEDKQSKVKLRKNVKKKKKKQQKTKGQTYHNMCWTPLYANEHK